MHSVNKPLIEYGDLQSVHHRDRHSQELAAMEEVRREEQPAALIVIHGIGGSYTVGWNKPGQGDLPRECDGLFTGKKQAQDAIQSALSRLANEVRQKRAAQANEVTKAKAAARKAEEQELALPEVEPEDSGVVAEPKVSTKKTTRKAK